MTLERIKQLIREDKIILFYKSKAWRIKKNEIRKRDEYECQECKKQGGLTTIQQAKLDVHHVKGLKVYPELAFVNSNLVTVCVNHHNILDGRIKPKKNKFINEERW
ncbi:MAG: HNH endonuclease [Bacilli bacterium]|nr:HNH endonuclease [Bacilli bacterium]